MTLHWWMHWFWVTTQFLVVLGNPVPSSNPETMVHPDSRTTSETPSLETHSVNPQGIMRQSFRVAKAIGLYPRNTAVILNRQATTVSTGSINRVTTLESVAVGSDNPPENFHENASAPSDPSRLPTMSTRADAFDAGVRNPTIKKESKITWILTTSKGSRSKYDQEDKDASRGQNVTSIEEVEDLTVLPLQEEEVSRVRLVLDKTKPPTPLSSSSSSSSVAAVPGSGDTIVRTFNRSDDDVEIDEEFIEPQYLATAASILQVGASESTRLSRARSAFPKDFQRDQVQGENRLADYNESSHGEESELSGSSRSAVDVAAITGSCLATVVLLSTMGSLGFIMYRRRYLNPPQTLNSDKCSNPDSSGYIDDSTIRDNSEEMYSLDNDSFLNSLEAMTIQNYWTDSVKHTKL